MSRGFRRRSSTPDIALPSIAFRDWKNISRILCVDESLNDSGAALFIDAQYQPVFYNGYDVGLFLTNNKSATQLSKISAYDKWLRSLIETHKPELVILESHPFMRGNAATSIATLEALVGLRYISMIACSDAKVSYAEFSTNHVKLIMCGATSAGKDVVQLVLTGCGYTLPKYSNKPDVVNDNVCDAMAMGEVICRMQKQELLRREYIQDVGPGRPQTKHRARKG
jgi:Holliday junction resolvasome RuvABC endonuclease subunit